jgi:hypothetical protein
MAYEEKTDWLPDFVKHLHGFNVFDVFFPACENGDCGIFYGNVRNRSFFAV